MSVAWGRFGRAGWTSLLPLLAAAVLVFTTASPVEGTNARVGNPSPDPQDISDCVLSAPSSLDGPTPDDDRDIAEEELDKAIDEFNSAPGVTQEFALNLSRVSPDPDCSSADVTIKSEDISGIGSWNDTTDVITMDSSRSWDIDGSFNKFDYRHILTHEMLHSLGIGHAGVGKDNGNPPAWWWNRNDDDPTSIDATNAGQTDLRTLEDDDFGGIIWASQGGSYGTADYWSPTGFENFSASWAKGDDTTVGVGFGTQGPRNGLRRAKMEDGGEGWALSWTVYDPWNTDNGTYNTEYESMTNEPEITVSAWVRNTTTTGTGDVDIYSRMHIFQYQSVDENDVNRTKAVADRDDLSGWTMWTVADSRTSANLGCCTWKEIDGTVSPDLFAWSTGHEEWHRAVRVGIKILNDTTVDILVDDAGLSGGI